MSPLLELKSPLRLMFPLLELMSPLLMIMSPMLEFMSPLLELKAPLRLMFPLLEMMSPPLGLISPSARANNSSDRAEGISARANQLVMVTTDPKYVKTTRNYPFHGKTAEETLSRAEETLALAP